VDVSGETDCIVLSSSRGAWGRVRLSDSGASVREGRLIQNY